jgi:glycosyltransferase involved in cell wall biosynthesis
MVLWGSRRGHLSTERQLGRRLGHVQIVRSPVNLRETSMVPRVPEARLQLASVARLKTAAKGQDLLLEALATDRWRSRDWNLSFYGGGRDLGYLRELAVHYALAEKVQFRGHVPDVRAIWAANDLLVLPSRVEGAPLALREAMLCGRPSVVTDVGGTTEWVEEGHTGFVADGVTARSLGAALERAWAARAQWTDIGARAHAVALERHDPSPGRTLLRILEEAAARRDSPSRPEACR